MDREMISVDALRKMIPDNLFAVMSDDELIISDRDKEVYVDVRLEAGWRLMSEADFEARIVKPMLTALKNRTQH